LRAGGFRQAIRFSWKQSAQPYRDPVMSLLPRAARAGQKAAVADQTIRFLAFEARSSKAPAAWTTAKK
jgi:hypothetical protein